MTDADRAKLALSIDETEIIHLDSIIMMFASITDSSMLLPVPLPGSSSIQLDLQGFDKSVTAAVLSLVYPTKSHLQGFGLLPPGESVNKIWFIFQIDCLTSTGELIRNSSLTMHISNWTDMSANLVVHRYLDGSAEGKDITTQEGTVEMIEGEYVVVVLQAGTFVGSASKKGHRRHRRHSSDLWLLLSVLLLPITAVLCSCFCTKSASKDSVIAVQEESSLL